MTCVLCFSINNQKSVSVSRGTQVEILHRAASSSSQAASGVSEHLSAEIRWEGCDLASQLQMHLSIPPHPHFVMLGTGRWRTALLSAGFQLGLPVGGAREQPEGGRKEKVQAVPCVFLVPVLMLLASASARGSSLQLLFALYKNQLHRPSLAVEAPAGQHPSSQV